MVVHDTIDGEARGVGDLHGKAAADTRSFPCPAQLMVTVGILVAQLINYGTQHHPWGWRVSLCIAFIPAFILFWV